MKSNRRLTFTFLGIGCILFIIALVIGIAENPPGIVLFYIAVFAWMLAFVHGWRETKKFSFLMVSSIIGVPVFILLHNAFYALNQLSADITVLNQPLEFLHALSFLIAIIICPVGISIGIVGTIAVYFKNRKSKV